MTNKNQPTLYLGYSLLFWHVFISYILSLMKDAALWIRENQIEKLKSVEDELMEELFSNKLIGKDEEFFDLVCPEVHQLNRNFHAET